MVEGGCVHQQQEQPWLIYAKEAKQSGGSDDNATCQVQGMDSAVGGCARKGHAACGGGGLGGGGPKNVTGDGC